VGDAVLFLLRERGMRQRLFQHSCRGTGSPPGLEAFERGIARLGAGVRRAKNRATAPAPNPARGFFFLFGRAHGGEFREVILDEFKIS